MPSKDLNDKGLYTEGVHLEIRAELRFSVGEKLPSEAESSLGLSAHGEWFG